VFQVGDISNLERELKIDEMQAAEKQNLGMFSQSELDLFMVRLIQTHSPTSLPVCVAFGLHKHQSMYV